MGEVARETGRRSKDEMACDILAAVSQGAGKPTRIMQITNLTWNVLFVYLAALLEGEFLARRESGNRFEYAITDRGRSALSLYTKLKEELASLHLESIFSAVPEGPRIGGERAGPALLSRLTNLVREEGFHVEENKVRGKTGVVHTFDCIATDSEGSRHAYLIRRSVSIELIVALFAVQLDSEIPVTIYYTNKTSAEAKKLARAYSLNLLRWPK